MGSFNHKVDLYNKLEINSSKRSTMQSKMAIQDIFKRNSHHNLFQIKITSHNASKETIESLSHAYILNKLALIPFQQHTKFTQLYKYSLQQLIALPQEYYKNDVFVLSLIDHICIWQERMGQFGTWPYTRSAFYSIEQKLKKNQELLEKVILRRAILQPNKQQFINKSLSQTFKNPELIELRKYYETHQQEQIVEEKKYNLPSDLLFQDADECWTQIYQKNDQFDKEQVLQYLRKYLICGLQRFISRRMKAESKQRIVESLIIRNSVYIKFEGKPSKQIGKWIDSFQQKASKK